MHSVALTGINQFNQSPNSSYQRSTLKSKSFYLYCRQVRKDAWVRQRCGVVCCLPESAVGQDTGSRVWCIRIYSFQGWLTIQTVDAAQVTVTGTMGRFPTNKSIPAFCLNSRHLKFIIYKVYISRKWLGCAKFAPGRAGENCCAIEKARRPSPSILTFHPLQLFFSVSHRQGRGCTYRKSPTATQSAVHSIED
jgi:hypothetical protein